MRRHSSRGTSGINRLRWVVTASSDHSTVACVTLAQLDSVILFMASGDHSTAACVTLAQLDSVILVTASSDYVTQAAMQ